VLARCDAEFAGIIGSLQARLSAIGIDPTPHVARYRTAYQSVKSSAMANLSK